MTTNAGAQDAAKFAIGFAGGKKSDETEEAIKRMFTPEFRNRLDAVVHFAGLSPTIIDRIVEKFVLQLEAQLADRGITFELDMEATRWLAERGFDDEMGARPLGRIIQEHVKKPIADEILFGGLKNGGVVKVFVDKNDPTKLDFEFVPDDPKPEEGAGVPALVEKS
ncbi:MAG: ATP-dependent Clp protease ATP-binding subunit ClpA, partial [Amphiplicatus sp.]